jgi:hypothetical protein
MNKLLAEAVRLLNALFAIVFIAAGVLGGVRAAFQHDAPQYAIMGGLLGFAIALVICGLLALFIEIRSELIKIRETLEQQSVSARTRVEPLLGAS